MARIGDRWARLWDRFQWEWNFGTTYGVALELLYAVGLPFVAVGSAVAAGWLYGYAPGPFAWRPLAVAVVVLAALINAGLFLGLGFHWWNGAMFLSQLLIPLCAFLLGHGVATSALTVFGAPDVCVIDTVVQRIERDQDGGRFEYWDHHVACDQSDEEIIVADRPHGREGEQLVIVYDPRGRLPAQVASEFSGGSDLSVWWTVIVTYTGVRVAYALWNCRDDIARWRTRARPT